MCTLTQSFCSQRLMAFLRNKIPPRVLYHLKRKWSGSGGEVEAGRRLARRFPDTISYCLIIPTPTRLFDPPRSSNLRGKYTKYMTLVTCVLSAIPMHEKNQRVSGRPHPWICGCVSRLGRRSGVFKLGEVDLL